MAGMAAEELVTGEFIANGVGAACDLAKATHLARTLEMQFGMGGLGFVYLDDTQAEHLATSPAALSATDGHLKAAFERASEIIQHDIDTVLELAEALQITGRLSGDDIGNQLTRYQPAENEAEPPATASSIPSCSASLSSRVISAPPARSQALVFPRLSRK